MKPLLTKNSASFFIVGLFLITYSRLEAQSNFVPLNSESYDYLRRFEILSGKISDELHLSGFPVSREDAILFLDTIFNGAADDGKRLSVNDKNQYKVHYYLRTDNNEWKPEDEIGKRKPILKYFYHNRADFFQYRSDDLLVKINPVFHFEIGKETGTDEILFTNTRGINVRGWIAKQVGYEFYLTENQARYPSYVRERIDSFDAVPYEGYYKEFKTDGVDFFDAKGYFDFTAAEFITIQFGHDKNFIGNGIRSLAISDFSEDYLFLKLQTQVWKIQYQNLFMNMTGNFLRAGDQLLPKKYSVMHHLSMNVTRWLNAGVFESVIFHRNDGLELYYLNPIIFYRSVEQLVGSPDNTLAGIDYRVNFLKHFSYYGQVTLDDYNIQVSKTEDGYWGNKYGTQQGIKYINAFTLSNLDLQVEWNRVRPYTYTHDDTVANYSNYNQPIAHPLGANFNELIGIVRYQPVFPLTLKAVLLYATQGRDTLSSNWGGNIFIPTTENNIMTIYGNEITQGVNTELMSLQLSASYMIFHNVFADALFVYRKTSADHSPFSSSSTVFQAGIRMNIARKEFLF